MTTASQAPRIIDAHIHVWSGDFDRYPMAPSVSKEDLWLPTFSAEEYFAYAGAVGDLRVNLVQMIWYVGDHSYMLDLIASDPETYSGTGVVDLEDPAPGKAMLDLARRGCRAFREPPGQLDHPAFETLFATAADQGLPLSFNMQVDLLPALEGLCRRFPKTPVILDHACHAGIREADYSADLEPLLRFAKNKQVMVKIGPFQALCSRQAPYLDVLPLIQRVVEAYGADRCMWESDSGGPIRMANPATDFPASVALIRDQADFLSPAEKEALLFGTAERIFFGGSRGAS